MTSHTPASRRIAVFLALLLMPTTALLVAGGAQASPVLFSDDFNDNSIDASKWTVANSGYTLAETNGEIEMTVREQFETLAVLRGANFGQTFDANNGVDANVDISRHIASTGGWVARPDLHVYSADGSKWIRLFYDPFYGVVRLSDSLGNVQTASNSGTDTGFHHFRIVATGNGYTGYYDTSSVSLSTTLFSGVTSARVELQEQTGGSTSGVTETSAHDNVVVYSYSTLTPPCAPWGLTALDGPSIGTIALQWSVPTCNGGTAITGYKVYRATASTGPFSWIATTGAGTTSYTDGGLTALQTYWYRVTAVNAVGEGPASNTACAKPYPYPDPVGGC